MSLGHSQDVVAKKVENPLAQDAAIKVLVGPQEGWDSHVMRVIELGVGGFSPKHAHPWPHINYFLEGEGTLLIEGKLVGVSVGDYAYVPANTEHQFKAAEHSPLKFICIVPKEGQY